MSTPIVKLVAYVLHVLWAFLAPVDARDVEGLRAFAPNYLTTEKAEENFYWARLASTVHHQDVFMVLAVAKHESNFKQDTETKEVGAKLSCGVMTPIPTHSKEECDRQKGSLLAGYLAGAEHLHTWYHAGGVYSANESLRGVGGGYKLIRACRCPPDSKTCRDHQPVLRYGTYGDDLCNIGVTFNWMRSQLIDSIKLAHRNAAS